MSGGTIEDTIMPNTAQTILKNSEDLIDQCESVSESSWPHEIDKLILSCNKIAMDYLKASQFDHCYELLKKAESLLISENEMEDGKEK